MNAILKTSDYIAGQPQSENDALLDQIVSLMGKMGGLTEEQMDEERKALKDSGISASDMMEIFGENLIDQLGPRQVMNVPVQTLTRTARIPKYAHDTDACADLYADEDAIVQPGETKLINTGLAFAVPEGWVIHIYPRSSTGVKTPLRLSNSVGVIDALYKDEVKLIFTNTGVEPYEIHQGDRLAQMSLDPCPMARFVEVENVKELGGDRGGGIGSTGA